MSTTNKIRGVNLGGWMVLENFITPYFFSLSDCHLKGDFRYYPDQVDAPPEGSALHKPMNHAECTPLPKHPIDEWTFVKTFRDANNGSGAFAQQYLDIHYDNFVKKEDLKALKAGGITHLRVPIGHWILGDITDDEPYVEGGWKYMKRLADWCREEGLQVWLDLHTAPGSQNGFDNSGHLGPKPSCNGWDESYYNFFKTETLAPNVVRTLKIIDHITEQVAKDGMTDVVTGFGLLNEPFFDCNYFSLVKFYEEGFNIVRANMGEETGVYVADSFNPGRFNGFAWKDAKYKNTYLDSHFYQTFEAKTRALSPRQHIATVCRNNHFQLTTCCYTDGVFSKGMGRISTEFSAMPDKDVAVQIPNVMAGIKYNGVAPELDRTLDKDRQAFLYDYVTAQIVNLDDKISSGWFYWNFKMEGGYCAEWDFLRGQREGWIPTLPPRNVNAAEEYGSCYDIMFQSTDSMSVIETFPPTPNGTALPDDDVVLAHGENVRKYFGKYHVKGEDNFIHLKYRNVIGSLLVVVALSVFLKRRKKSTYQKIESVDVNI